MELRTNCNRGSNLSSWDSILNNGDRGKELGELAALLSVDEEEAEVLIIDGGLRIGVCDPSIARELLAAGRFCLERNAFDALPRFFCSRLYSQSRPKTRWSKRRWLDVIIQVIGEILIKVVCTHPRSVRTDFGHRTWCEAGCIDRRPSRLFASWPCSFGLQLWNWNREVKSFSMKIRWMTLFASADVDKIYHGRNDEAVCAPHRYVIYELL